MVPEMDGSLPFDLFISYAQADQAWVKGFLLNGLTQAGVRFCSEADFEPGVPRLDEFERAITQSQRTLLVLSPAYLADSVQEFINRLAAHYGLETNTWPVIPLVLHPVAQLPIRLAMLEALDATDPEASEAVLARLCAALRRPAPPSAPPLQCPYPGMTPFGEADAEHFFGRDNDIHAALNALRLHPFLAVIGPSGCGKSSFVLAGLLPRLRTSGLFGAGGWLVRVMRPGEKPLAVLTETLGYDPGDAATASGTALASQPGAQRLLLVVDQFEEVFAPTCVDAAAFQAALGELAGVPGCFVIITVRADFYDKLLGSTLWRQIQSHRIELAPLDADGIRQAITRPAERAGAYVEAALAERLIAETNGELGFLPFLQETLVLLWERIERRLLTLHTYETLVLARRAYTSLDGVTLTGLQVAMAQRADQALSELDATQQQIARRIFVRLVQFGAGRADTRRQQAATELGPAGDPQFESTLMHLAKRRLLILGGGEQPYSRRVDLAHEALIEGWPQLRQWLRELRQAEIERRRLAAKADEWLRLDRRGGLLDAAELAEAERWMASATAAILGYTEPLQLLVQASRAAITQAEQAQAAAKAREREQIEQRAAAQLSAARRLRWLRAMLALLASALLTILAWFGYAEWTREHTGSPLIDIQAVLATIESMQGESITVPAFQIEQYEVSNDQYRACVFVWKCAEPSWPERFANRALSNHPVVGVSPIHAQEYCMWIGRRLPTSIEWERAARGPHGRRWPWGKEAPSPSYVQLPPGAPDTHTLPVASLDNGATRLPEAGIYHMADNVAELVIKISAWCKESNCYDGWKSSEQARSGFMGSSFQLSLASIDTFVPWRPDSEQVFIGFRCVAGPYAPAK
jgi:formylglycine-generating enzyme required for sulfatase activity